MAPNERTEDLRRQLAQQILDALVRFHISNPVLSMVCPMLTLLRPAGLRRIRFGLYRSGEVGFREIR
jgi:hypothetical protein